MGVLWTITGIVVPLLIGIGLALMTLPNPSSREFLVAKVCFWLAMLILAGMTLFWELKTESGFRNRVVTGIVMGALIFVLFPVSIQWVESRANKVVGPDTPRFSERFDRFTVHYGGTRCDISNKNGSQIGLLTIKPDGSGGVGGNPNEPRSSNDEVRLVVTVNDNQLLVDADLFTGPGQPPMHVRRNEISGRPLKMWENPGWDKQSSGSALEIVNQDRFPVLQIIYLDNAQVIINGVFVSGERAVILTDEQMVVAVKSELNEFLKHFPIKRLFKYPAWKYRGVYEDESTTQPPSTPDTGASPP
jgi:hypothetical protein